MFTLVLGSRQFSNPGSRHPIKFKKSKGRAGQGRAVQCSLFREG